MAQMAIFFGIFAMEKKMAMSLLPIIEELRLKLHCGYINLSVHNIYIVNSIVRCGAHELIKKNL